MPGALRQIDLITASSSISIADAARDG